MLRRRGIRDEAVLAAMERVPREKFLPPELADEAYVDTALPIDCHQTISQPTIVAMMTEALELSK
jgi:protein-L-isoaspartate(D-aspartate) O-methyltransferase